MGYFRALNRSRGTVLCERLENAHNFAARARGLLGRHALEEGQGMLFAATPWIPAMWMHMFGMRFAVDIVFLDQDGRVVRINHELRPWRVSSLVFGARCALELPAGSAKSSGTQVGDRVTLESFEAG